MTKSVKQGFVSALHVPIWSEEVFFGQACATEKEAKVSAAEAFLSNPAVIEAAAKLPPPAWKTRKHVREENKDTLRSLSNSKKSRFAEELKEASKERFNSFREEGCGNAFWDGVA